jgi:hypothetical protein
MRRTQYALAAIALVSMLVQGCARRVRPAPAPAPPPIASARVAVAPPLQPDALALSDALEAQIAAGTDTPADRERVYDEVRANEEDTAAYTFARAAVTGRLVQVRGLLAANLVGDVERYARRSVELDPGFRDGAATRMLGTLYVFAPATLLAHGDSERGIEMLESLVEQRPDLLENHLRLAEAYVALGDPTPARPHLCRCFASKDVLRPDDQALLARLANDAGPLGCDSQR